MNTLQNKDIREVEEKIRKLEKAFQKLADIDVVTKEMSEIRSELEGSILSWVKRIELDKYFSNVDNRVNKINTELSLMLNKISKIDKEMRSMDVKLANRVIVSDYKYDTNLISKTYAKVTELNQTRNQVIPIVEDFKVLIESFKRSNEEHTEMIKRFDEILWDKASKVSITEIFKELTNYVTIEKFNSVSEFKNSVIEDLDLMYLRISDIK